MTNLTLPFRVRIVALVTTTVLLAIVAVGYTFRAAGSNERVSPKAAASAITPGLYFRTTSGGVSAAPTPSGDPIASKDGQDTGLACHRFHWSETTAVCLTARAAISPRTEVKILDRDLKVRRTVTVGGTPNRARVSRSGRMVSWTLFVSGDSYASSSFSTRSGLLDLQTGYLVKNLETLQLYVDGKRYEAPDVNYWGITFAADDNRFFATLSSAGRTYLVEGDLKAWTARTLRQNVECPSLSPDGSRIVFKKRVRAGTKDPWRLHVLDLKTMTETPLAETRSVDDQAAWLDDTTVAYALPGRTKGSSDIWSVRGDGSASEPRLLVRDASSPAPVTKTG